MSVHRELTKPHKATIATHNDRAVDAFHQALGMHMGHAGATWSRGHDRVDGPATAVVEALLLSGWTGPQDDSEPADLGLAETGDQRPTPRCRSRRPMPHRRQTPSRDGRF